MSEKRVIGVIAGNGIYPSIFVQAARRHGGEGISLVAAAFQGETKEDLKREVEVFDWFRVGQVGKVIKYFKKNGVRECVMVGQIAPRNLFDLWPDMRTLKILSGLKERNAESLFGAVAAELEKEGITLLPATTFLDDLLPPAGLVCGPEPSERDWEDLRFGFQMVKETSRLDIGQSIVVRRGTVLAVEAFEGTDACIRRGGELGKGKDVALVKVSKPNQDMRFDVPVVGPTTIQTCQEAGVRLIGVEAGRTLLLDMEAIEKASRKAGISLVALGEDALERG